ncbi:hypothetical protein [Nostoc punctiforme]|uniref:hypothetical protein n=1 Tax=Nostoc punctiforme TaxID=272131 RepID=UPI001427DBEE|nr:hypothetical protein [Nostoc punctiforme]
MNSSSRVEFERAAANTETMYRSFIAVLRDFWRILRRKDVSRSKRLFEKFPVD